MIVYSYVALAPGTFAALKQGAQNDGHLSASDGYELYRHGEQSGTLYIRNSKCDLSKTLHEVPWSSVLDAQRDESKTKAACVALALAHEAPVKLAELLAPPAPVAPKVTAPKPAASAHAPAAQGFPGQRQRGAAPKAAS